MAKTLSRASVAARLIETAENYSHADRPLETQRRKRAASQSPVEKMPEPYSDDGKFWHAAFQGSTWGKTYSFHRCVLSEWVARVPGLYWKPGSEELRRLSPAAVESRSRRWTTYVPSGKSQKVLGGVGTLRLPRAADGYHLASLTTTLNASSGVPALIAPDVWFELGLKEGSVLVGHARWQEMDERWSSRFKSTARIPLGHLLLDNVADLQVVDQSAPVLVHPFTIMRYEQKTAELYDFVYCEEDTSKKSHRTDIAKFFAKYKQQNKRYGQYLLVGDLVDPLWDAEFRSPEQLRSADNAADSQLRLLEARVAQCMLGDSTIEALLAQLPSGPYTHEDLKRISTEVGIAPGLWFAGSTLSKSAGQLMDKVVERKKLPELIDLLQDEHPEWFRGERRA
jgi:hypothetical protein